MTKIKLAAIDDLTKRPYLDQNPDFADQLVATLNQVDGFSSNELEFYADAWYWTYDYWFSPNFEINKNTFVIANDQIAILSTNRDDLLNVHYYQKLSDLAHRHPLKPWCWSYFPQDQVLQLESNYLISPEINIKLTKPIDQYDQKQINAMGKFMTNAYDLIVKDDGLDWEQFDGLWKQRFDDVRSIAIVFDLNDFANPKILMRWWNKGTNQYENDLLKQVLKDNSPLLKFLNNNDFQSNFLDWIKHNKVVKDF